ncbi:MAG: hypothetical protein RL701_5848, partial [Pseudomonadota bacterium]
MTSVEWASSKIDHDHARAQRGHVCHVVAGQNHGRALLFVVATDELAHRCLHGDVEPDGRLIEKQHARSMQERRSELTLHALAERELAHGLLQQRLELQHVHELIQAALEGRAIDAVKRAIELEGLGRRQVPEQLLFLSSHQHDRGHTGRTVLQRARTTRVFS